MSSPYAQVGAKLVERGYAAIPVMPGTKRPGHVVAGGWVGMDDWRARYAARLPSDAEVEAWSEPEGAGVCVVAGPASGDLVGIDMDVDDETILAALRAVLPPSPVRKAGAKGETALYRGPGVTSRSFNGVVPGTTQPQRLVDIIGAGRQTVLPPTIHPDTGEPYRWIGDEALENIDPADLPELPADIGERIAAALAPFGYVPPPPPRATGDADSPFRFVNDAAMADLARWVPRLGLYKLRPYQGGYRAVATWRASNSGRPTEKRHPNLKIHPSGIRDFHDGDRAYTPIDLVMAASGCDFDTAFGQLVGWLGLATEIAIELAPKVTHERLDDGSLMDVETGEILSEPIARDAAAADPRDYPDADLEVPGLVGEIADWIMATSPRPIRLFATAAALITVGTLVSRRVYCGVPRSGAHLYLMTIAGTGAGKERPQEAVRQILDAAANQRLHAAEPSSAASLAVRLAERPVQVQIVDEVDRILRKVGHRMASSQEAEMLQSYCTLWGRSVGTFIPSSTTVRGDILINRPALSFYGATTFTSFYEHLRAKMLAGGFLNRFLVLPRFQRVPRNAAIVPDDEVPPEIVEKAQRLFQFQDRPPPGASDRTFMPPSTTLLDPSHPPPMLVIDMTDGARAIYEACQLRDEEMLIRSDGEPLLEAWSRGAEMTKRIALVTACGRYASGGLDGVVVEEGDMAFAAGLVDWSIGHFVTGLRENMAENQHQADSKMVLGLIRTAGQIGRSDLLRKIDGRIETRQLDSMIRLLIDGDQIQEARIAPPGRGRPKTIYTFGARMQPRTSA